MVGLKKFLPGMVLSLLFIAGFSGMGWAALETVVTFGMVESLSAASATLTDNFNKGSVVYVRVDNAGTTQGNTVSSHTATVKDNIHTTNQITFTVYDDGTFPDDKANDGYYWGKFTIVDGDYPFTDDSNDILGLASGETATITCDLDNDGFTNTHQVTACFSPPDHTKPSVDTFEVTPNPFSPNGDGVQDTTSISYSLSDNISTRVTVRLEIRDTSNKIVKTLVDAQTQDTGKVYTYSWDGKDDSGNPSSEGSYTCRIIALDGSGNSVESTLGITIDTTPPQITDVSLSPNPFSPNSDGVKDTTTISFTLSGAAASQNKVKIRNSSGTLIRTLDDEISPSGGQNGSNSVTWDGKDENGAFVSDGSYFFEIWAQDAAGNMNSFTGVVKVDTTAPATALQVLDNTQTHTSPFDAGDLGTSAPTGLYISDVKVNGEWQTQDSSGIYQVQIMINGSSFTPQNPNGNWQGWYLYWTPPASNGTYTIQVRAIDNVGNDSGASGASTTIIYDNSSPTSQITSPPDGTKFNTSSLTISGTASDGDGCGVKEVQVQVTNLSTSSVIVSFATSSVTDTSSQGDWSSWEYIFTPPDSGSPPVSYLIECRAVDNLYDPTSSTSSSHVQATPYSITVTYDTQSPPYHPTSLKDDGVLLSTGHIFGINNLLTANQAYFSGLQEVRFEYKVEPSGSWQVIGSSPYTEAPPASYVAQVSWDTTALSSGVTYSFRAVAVGASEIPSGTFSQCRIDNTSPSSPYNLKDDGTSITSGHIFGRTNVLSAEADTGDSSLWGVRFEYRDYTSLGSWISIGTDTLPEGNNFSVTWDTSGLDTTHTYWVRATAIDVASNETSSQAITNCSIQLSLPLFQSISKDKDVYKNGSTITIFANLDNSGYTLSCDFSPIDSEYGEGNNVEQVTDNGDSTYTITYQISSYNTRSDSSYTVVLTATDPAGNSATSSVTVKLDNTPPGFTSSTDSDRSVCKNGDTVSLTCHLDASGYTVEADFSNIDTTYSSGEEQVTDNGDGTYTITYTIGEANTKTDGTYSVPVTATDAAGNQAVDADSGFSVELTLDNTPPQFSDSPVVGKFVDSNLNNQIDEGEVNWNTSYFKNGDIIIIQTHLDSSGYATSTSVCANFFPLDDKYSKNDEQPAIPGDGSLSGGGSLNLLDKLDNDEDGQINNQEESSYYLIAYRINTANTRSDGSYSINITATDAAGNQATSSEGAVCNLDNTPPSVQNVWVTLITQSASSVSLNNTCAIKEEITSLKVVFSDEGSGVDVASSDVALIAPDGSVIQGENVTRGDDFIELSWSLDNLPLTTQGTYTVRADVKDIAGNSTSDTGYSFIYDTVAPHLVSTTPSNLSTVSSPLTSITAVISEDTTQATQVAGVDIKSCLITLKDGAQNVIVSGGQAVDASTLRLEAEPGGYLATSSGSYFIEVKSVDYAGNARVETSKFYLKVDPVNSVAKASLDYGGKTVYDMSGSTEATSPSCFANSRINTVYVKLNLNEGIHLNSSASSISLLKIKSIQTGNIQADPVDGSSKINYNAEEGWVEFFFYPASSFDPEKDEHTKDGSYWVRVDVVDSSGNTQELSFFFVYDTISPSPPQFSVQSFNSTTGVLTLSGTTRAESSEPQWVQIFVNGVSKATTQAEEDGSFSIQAELSSGENSIALRAIDRAGNVGNFTDPISLSYNPQHLLAITFRSSKILRRGSGISPVKLTYYLTEPADVTIRIYNLLGEIVYDWQGQVTPGSEEEFSWWGENMFGERVNNGVYIISIRAVSSSRSETVTKLIGVLR